MIKYISKRLLMMIPVLLGVILLVFIVMNLASGNAVMLILGDNATEEAVQQKTEERAGQATFGPLRKLCNWSASWGYGQKLYFQPFRGG